MDRLPEDVLARRAALPTKPAEVTLRGERVVLRPIDLERDAEPLHAVSCGAPFELGGRRVEAYDPEEQIWQWMKGRPFASAVELRAYLEPFASAGDARLLTVLDRATGTPIGAAAFKANRPADLKLELGHVWYGPIAQGTGVASEATRLMCAHAFGLGYRRIEWKCDVRNDRSRRAALSWGFTFEGIHEAYGIVKDRSRDIARYRMLAHEWAGIQR
jgi:RimJ/RimL family protein N-acetyltransferase